VPFEIPLIEITVIIIPGHGREQFSNSIHSAVYVNHLSGARQGGVELTESGGASTLIIVMETIEPPPQALQRRDAHASISFQPLYPDQKDILLSSVF
jgi:hypothetical protein